MSADVVAVLVVPAEGDPGGLLSEGACGGIPASVTRPEPARQVNILRRCFPERFSAVELDQLEQWHRSTSSDNAEDMALPLWWEGAFCPEGWDRARRMMRRSGGPPMPDDADGAVHAATWAARLVRVGLASRVIRLVRVDGRLVELEPVRVGT